MDLNEATEVEVRIGRFAGLGVPWCVEELDTVEQTPSLFSDGEIEQIGRGESGSGDCAFFSMGNSTGKHRALRQRTQSKEYSELEDKIQDQCETLHRLPLNFLKAITGDFSERQEIGRDRFGVVYKGVFHNGKVIAVKKLSETHIDDDQFQKEVASLLRLKHKNVVKLVGYCAESQWEAAEIDGNYAMAEVRKRLLCYEYTKNKRLDNHRFSIPTAEPYGLTWRMSGYMAPEYLANGLVSLKADIFSFGVIIIELMTGGRRDYPSTEEAYEHFVENVVGSWRKILKDRYRHLEYYIEQVKTCISTGLMCVNADPNERPTTRDILEKLTKPYVTPNLEDLLHADVELLGKGTYGTVYKATLENGTIVAFRRLRLKMTMGKKYFMDVVGELVKIRHPNLLPPKAYFVDERHEKLIIIDYMPRGSLSAFLQG
ncbi:hypothetical protein HU200_029156 [Digitaria exilis]|uniref:Protein kinase domain-containing protein n=1 Tax=Digitaria exilis TaxID=1010633 RepID=A0A835EUX7_9POAL|nr:hypothetical protein HU200_029156 [Digitaria exilis]